ncbi:MAG: biotin/lipoyl-binding protein [Planctomycetes bacterium]|nr:biotin/lipoyl-binding protein [Planctomycetota bacterium]
MHRIRLSPVGGFEALVDEVILQRDAEGAAGRFDYRRGEAHHTVVVEWVGGRGLLRIGGRVAPFHAVRDKRRVTVWLAGRRYSFELAERMARARPAADSAAPAGDITAAMPGTILKVEVRPGDAFTAHQPLIIMESMKMEMTLSSPHPGRVKEVTCHVGQLVPIGAVLIRVADAEAD